MKRVIKIFLLIILLLLVGCGKQVTLEEARQALHNNLIERYGEEFEIGYMGKRSRGEKIWYQAEIYPAKYKGTPKENDEYYKSHGNVNIEKDIFGEKIGYVGDLYRVVLFNESANEFYLPKLKELFGENVLPVLEIDSSRVSKNPEFLSNPKFLPEYKKRLEDGSLPFLKGGIYIFGRVENDKDREWYRKQIYEFVQFMKQTGTFEYVDLRIVISDEKVLSYQFQNDNELKNKIVKLRLNSKNDKLFFKQRTELMKKIDINKVTKEEQQEILNSINKGNFIDGGFADFVGGNSIFYKKLYSPKYIESQNLDEELKVEYNNLDEMKFTWEMY